MNVNSQTIGFRYWLGGFLARLYYAAWIVVFHVSLWRFFGYPIFWVPTDIVSGVIGAGIGLLLMIPAMVAGIICGAATYYGVKLLVSVIRE